MIRKICSVAGMSLVAVSTVLSAQSSADSVSAAPRYAATAAALTRFIEHEMVDKGLPALSVAIVEDQTVVWARGFGVTDRTTANTAAPGTLRRERITRNSSAVSGLAVRSP